MQANQRAEQCQNSAKQCQNSDILDTRLLPATASARVTSKRPKNKLYLVRIRGMALRHVSRGGHVSGLKSNRRVFGAQTVE